MRNKHDAPRAESGMEAGIFRPTADIGTFIQSFFVPQTSHPRAQATPPRNAASALHRTPVRGQSGSFVDGSATRPLPLRPGSEQVRGGGGANGPGVGEEGHEGVQPEGGNAPADAILTPSRRIIM